MLITRFFSITFILAFSYAVSKSQDLQKSNELDSLMYIRLILERSQTNQPNTQKR
jgi:hypothetical protein